MGTKELEIMNQGFPMRWPSQIHPQHAPDTPSTCPRASSAFALDLLGSPAWNEPQCFLLGGPRTCIYAAPANGKSTKHLLREEPLFLLVHVLYHVCPGLCLQKGIRQVQLLNLMLEKPQGKKTIFLIVSYDPDFGWYIPVSMKSFWQYTHID